MRRAFLSTILSVPWGGADKLWTCAADAALDDGDAVLLGVSYQVSTHPRIKRLISGGARIHVRQRFTQPAGRRAAFREWLLNTIGREESLYSALSGFRPDAVYVCQGGTFDFLVEPGLIRWLAGARVPFTLICQANNDCSAMSEEERSTARSVFAAAKSVVFVSSQNLRLAERQIAAPIPHAVVVQNPVDLRSPGLTFPDNDVPQFAVVSRMDAFHKGLDVLLEALGSLRIRQAAWHLNLYGDGPDTLYLKALAERNDLRHRVTFHGFVSDIREVWNQNHVLLLPSRFEGCALAMLEALASGRPVMATDVGGVRDWIVDDVNGFICGAATPELLEATLHRVLEARLRWRQMSEAALDTAARMKLSPERDVLR